MLLTNIKPRNLLLVTFLMFSALVLSSVFFSQKAHADYNAGNLIDDAVFLDANSMNQTQIQSFLTSMGGQIAGKSFYMNCDMLGQQSKQIYLSLGAPCDQNATSAQIIYYAARAYGINPRVIIATIQKEQSLITAVNPTSRQYGQVMGYACPTTGECNGNSNFLWQIDNGTWVLRYHYERAKGNNTWWNSGTWAGSGCGGETVYRKPNAYPKQNVNFYDEGGRHYTTVYIQNAATSAFYCYTPHVYNNFAGCIPAWGVSYASWKPSIGNTGNCYSGSYNFVSAYETWFGSAHSNESVLKFQSHVSTIGWTEITDYSGQTGTTGQQKSMEAFKLNGKFEYSSYSHEKGWQPLVNNGMISGSVGLRRPIQAVKISPLSSISEKYDILYRTHVSNIGWMGWTKNGAIAGTTGDSTKNIEALEIQLIPKNIGGLSTSNVAYINYGTINDNTPLQLNIASHVGTVGWQPEVKTEMVSGTIKEKKRIEAFRINVSNATGLSGGVNYSAHVANVGWQDIKSNNDIAGTVGEKRQIEAFRIGLSSQLADNYDIWYRAHVATIGWMGWTKNGLVAGSVGAGLQVEAIEIRLTPKNSSTLIVDSNSVYNPKGRPMPSSSNIRYSTHAAELGWLQPSASGQINGTVKQSRRLEAIRIDNISSINGDLEIRCTVYARERGWLPEVTGNSICGTTGEAREIQAMKLTLIGNSASKYNIRYRVHVSNIGWMNWVPGGSNTGTAGQNQIEAIEIIIENK